MKTKTYLGIEIGGTKLQLVLGDEQAQITERFRFDVNKVAGAEGIRRCISETLQSLNGTKISAIGVGYGGPIDRIAGTVLTSYQIKGWSGFPLRDWLEDISGVPAVVENDANTAALGEAMHGAGETYGNVLYITLGSGVGAGIVLDKKIYHGALPSEAEMGHIRLDKSGRTIESSCSGWAVDKKIRDVARNHPSSALAKLTAGMEGGEAKRLAEAIRVRDAIAVEVLGETCDDLAFGLSHAVHLLHPETIILGGGLAFLGEPLRKLVAERLTGYIMDVFQPGPLIHLSSLKEDAVPVGALELAIQHKP